MNKDIKIARLEQKLSKAKSEIKKLKKETPQKASESKNKPSKKKRIENCVFDGRTTTISFDSIERYSYTGDMITMAIFLCIYAGLSARKAVKSMEVMNHMLHGVFGDIPAHTTIRTWLAK